MSNKEKDEFHLLTDKIEELKNAQKTIRLVVTKQAAQTKYLVGVIRKLKGELIQLSHEIDGLKNNGRRK